MTVSHIQEPLPGDRGAPRLFLFFKPSTAKTVNDRLCVSVCLLAKQQATTGKNQEECFQSQSV